MGGKEGREDGREERREKGREREERKERREGKREEGREERERGTKEEKKERKKGGMKEVKDEGREKGRHCSHQLQPHLFCPSIESLIDSSICSTSNRLHLVNVFSLYQNVLPFGQEELSQHTQTEIITLIAHTWPKLQWTTEPTVSGAMYRRGMGPWAGQHMVLSFLAVTTQSL